MLELIESGEIKVVMIEDKRGRFARLANDLVSEEPGLQLRVGNLQAGMLVDRGSDQLLYNGSDSLFPVDA